MITFKLDGRQVEAEEGETILRVAQRYNVYIPTLCYHKALTPAGACRLCTVEIFDGRRTRLVTSCNYPVWRDIEVKVDSERVIKGRKMIVELLLARCPGVKLLQDLAKEYGIEKPRFEPETSDCILCGLCVRMCERGKQCYQPDRTRCRHGSRHSLSRPDRCLYGLWSLCLRLSYWSYQAGRYYQTRH